MQISPRTHVRQTPPPPYTGSGNAYNNSAGPNMWNGSSNSANHLSQHTLVNVHHGPPTQNRLYLSHSAQQANPNQNGPYLSHSAQQVNPNQGNGQQAATQAHLNSYIPTSKPHSSGYSAQMFQTSPRAQGPLSGYSHMGPAVVQNGNGCAYKQVSYGVQDAPWNVPPNATVLPNGPVSMSQPRTTATINNHPQSNLPSCAYQLQGENMVVNQVSNPQRAFPVNVGTNANITPNNALLHQPQMVRAPPSTIPEQPSQMQQTGRGDMWCPPPSSARDGRMEHNGQQAFPATVSGGYENIAANQVNNHHRALPVTVGTNANIMPNNGTLCQRSQMVQATICYPPSSVSRGSQMEHDRQQVFQTTGHENSVINQDHHPQGACPISVGTTNANIAPNEQPYQMPQTVRATMWCPASATSDGCTMENDRKMFSSTQVYRSNGLDVEPSQITCHTSAISPPQTAQNLNGNQAIQTRNMNQCQMTPTRISPSAHVHSAANGSVCVPQSYTVEETCVNHLQLDQRGAIVPNSSVIRAEDIHRQKFPWGMDMLKNMQREKALKHTHAAGNTEIYSNPMPLVSSAHQRSTPGLLCNSNNRTYGQAVSPQKVIQQPSHGSSQVTPNSNTPHPASTTASPQERGRRLLLELLQKRAVTVQIPVTRAADGRVQSQASDVQMQQNQTLGQSDADELSDWMKLSEQHYTDDVDLCVEAVMALQKKARQVSRAVAVVPPISQQPTEAIEKDGDVLMADDDCLPFKIDAVWSFSDEKTWEKIEYERLITEVKVEPLSESTADETGVEETARPEQPPTAILDSAHTPQPIGPSSAHTSLSTAPDIELKEAGRHGQTDRTPSPSSTAIVPVSLSTVMPPKVQVLSQPLTVSTLVLTANCLSPAVYVLSPTVPTFNVHVATVNTLVPTIIIPAPKVNTPVPSVTTPTMNISVPLVNALSPKVNAPAPSVSTPTMNTSVPLVSALSPKVNTPALLVNAPGASVSTLSPTMSAPAPKLNAPASSVKAQGALVNALPSVNIDKHCIQSADSVSDGITFDLSTVPVVEYTLEKLNRLVNSKEEKAQRHIISEPPVNLVQSIVDLYWDGSPQNIIDASLTDTFQKIRQDVLNVVTGDKTLVFSHIKRRNVKKMSNCQILEHDITVPMEVFRSLWLNVDEQPDLDKVLAEPISEYYISFPEKVLKSSSANINEQQDHAIKANVQHIQERHVISLEEVQKSTAVGISELQVDSDHGHPDSLFPTAVFKSPSINGNDGQDDANEGRMKEQDFHQKFPWAMLRQGTSFNLPEQQDNSKDLAHSLLSKEIYMDTSEQMDNTDKDHAEDIQEHHVRYYVRDGDPEEEPTEIPDELPESPNEPPLNGSEETDNDPEDKPPESPNVSIVKVLSSEDAMMFFKQLQEDSSEQSYMCPEVVSVSSLGLIDQKPGQAEVWLLKPTNHADELFRCPHVIEVGSEFAFFCSKCWSKTETLQGGDLSEAPLFPAASLQAVDQAEAPLSPAASESNSRKTSLRASPQRGDCSPESDRSTVHLINLDPEEISVKSKGMTVRREKRIGSDAKAGLVRDTVQEARKSKEMEVSKAPSTAAEKDKGHHCNNNTFTEKTSKCLNISPSQPKMREPSRAGLKPSNTRTLADKDVLSSPNDTLETTASASKQQHSKSNLNHRKDTKCSSTRHVDVVPEGTPSVQEDRTEVNNLENPTHEKKTAPILPGSWSPSHTGPKPSNTRTPATNAAKDVHCNPDEAHATLALAFKQQNDQDLKCVTETKSSPTRHIEGVPQKTDNVQKDQTEVKNSDKYGGEKHTVRIESHRPLVSNESPRTSNKSKDKTYQRLEKTDHTRTFSREPSHHDSQRVNGHQSGHLERSKGIQDNPSNSIKLQMSGKHKHGAESPPKLPEAKVPKVDQSLATNPHETQPISILKSPLASKGKEKRVRFSLFGTKNTTVDETKGSRQDDKDFHNWPNRGQVPVMLTVSCIPNNDKNYGTECSAKEKIYNDWESKFVPTRFRRRRNRMEETEEMSTDEIVQQLQPEPKAIKLLRQAKLKQLAEDQATRKLQKAKQVDLFRNPTSRSVLCEGGRKREAEEPAAPPPKKTWKSTYMKEYYGPKHRKDHKTMSG